MAGSDLVKSGEEQRCQIVGVIATAADLEMALSMSTPPDLFELRLDHLLALLEEVEFKAFTFCDPDDANAATAVSTAGCAVPANNESILPLGPEAGETRDTYDNVSDYNGLSLSPATDIIGNSIIGYAAAISVTQQQLEVSIPLDASLRITVTVTHGSDSLSLSGYRLRYAPRSLP